MSISKIIRLFKRRHTEQNKERKQENKEQKQDCISKQELKEMYIEFVRGYLRNTKKLKVNLYLRHIDYKEFLVVKKSGAEIPRWCGAKSKTIIVPKGVKVKYTDIGHNTLLFMDGYKLVGSLYLYIYDLPEDVLSSDKFQCELRETVKMEFKCLVNRLETNELLCEYGKLYGYGYLKYRLNKLIEVLFLLRVDMVDDEVNQIVKQVIEVIELLNKEPEADIVREPEVVNISREFMPVCRR